MMADEGSPAAADAAYTLYVGNIAPGISEEELSSLFAPLGPPPTSVKLMRDKHTGIPSGFGFVTFSDHVAAERALELNGQVAWGRPLKLQWAQHRGGGGPQASPAGEGQSFDVFVGDLARDIDEEKLREAFGHLGTVTRVVVMWDYPTGRNKGYGFVSFATQQEAENAIQQMHGAVVGSRPVRCGWGQRRTPQGGSGGHHGGQHHQYQQHQQQQHPFPPRGGRGSYPNQFHQQQQWGGQPRGGGQAPGQQPFGNMPEGFPAGLSPMMGMMGLQLGLDLQQAQQLQAQLAQHGMAFPAAAGRSPGGGEGQPGSSPGQGGGAFMANGLSAGIGQGRPGGKSGKGGGGGQAAAAEQHAKAQADIYQAQSSSVSIPALADTGRSVSAGAGIGCVGSGAGASCCVRVDNVDKTVQKAELFGAFAKFGTLEDCNIVRKGNPYHAIIRFATPQQAADAAASMNGFSLDGRRLRCVVEGTSPGPHAGGGGGLPRPKSTSDLPMPPRALDRSHAVEKLAAKMRAVLQDRRELPVPSPPGDGRAAAAAPPPPGEAGAAPGHLPDMGTAGFGGGPLGGGQQRGERVSPRGGPGVAGPGFPGGFGGAMHAGRQGLQPHAGPQHPQPHAGPQHPQHSQHQQHHQWMAPGQSGEATPIVAGGNGGRGGGGGAQHAKHAAGPPPSWAQQEQHMLSPQLLMMQQQAAAAAAAQQAAAQQHLRVQQGGGGGGAAGGAAATGGAAQQLLGQQGMSPPMAFGPGGVVLPPQLAMLNMMAQGVPGPPPAFTLPMVGGYGGQPMVNPPGMQPGFAALHQQALIQQLLLHQQRQAAEQQASAAAAAAAVVPPEQAGGVAAAPQGPESIASQAESVPSAGGTPPPISSTPPPIPEPPAQPAAAPAANS